MTTVKDALTELYRRDYGRMLASLIRVTQDFALAEDALHEAFVSATTQWHTGLPAEPAGWLFSTARFKAIDQLRRATKADEQRGELARLLSWNEQAPAATDTLRLIFTCCHPALAREAQTALTLHTVCGLRTEEIARAFVVPLTTLAQRLVRAKAKIKAAKIPYEVPEEATELTARLEAVLEVIYLVFNEGYAASFGHELVRESLCDTAIDLGRLVVELLPGQHEAQGLLALMLLHDARRAARTDAQGELILLEHQDRQRWNHASISEGSRLVERALRGRPVGPYAVQAAIAALHDQAPSAADTDWRQIAALYGVLIQLQPTPVVEINRAVAIAMADGLERGLALLQRIHQPGYHLLPAARAELLRRLNRIDDAVQAYTEAIALVTNEPERRYLERRVAELRVS